MLVYCLVRAKQFLSTISESPLTTNKCEKKKTYRVYKWKIVFVHSVIHKPIFVVLLCLMKCHIPSFIAGISGLRMPTNETQTMNVITWNPGLSLLCCFYFSYYTFFVAIWLDLRIHSILYRTLFSSHFRFYWKHVYMATTTIEDMENRNGNKTAKTKQKKRQENKNINSFHGCQHIKMIILTSMHIFVTERMKEKISHWRRNSFCHFFSLA